MAPDPIGSVSRAAHSIRTADALLITAGAGIGVDSGLPDFRGDEGFWKAYPPLAKLGISFVDMANPFWFGRDPELAWGFYGHRLALYRATTPHAGFGTLRSWAAGMARGGFVFTSNVDGQFQAAGFPPPSILECHGSIAHLQCTRPCCQEIWPGHELEVAVDPETFRAAPPLPSCPACGALARPNVLMFNDWQWIPRRSSEQERRFEAWLDQASAGRLVIVELGAGTGVPTIRLGSERIARSHRAALVRINLREPEVPPDQIGIPLGALEALKMIDGLLR